jgi:predicted Zn-dependent protease
LAGIGQRLGHVTETPAAEFRFTLLNSDIVNAMALPGGYVYVTRGLMTLADNEAELAGVVGHELGHILARHSAQRYSRAMASNVVLGILGMVIGQPGLSDLANLGASYWLQSFSQENEFEADSLGVRYLSRGGWHAEGMASFLDKLRDHSRLDAIMAGRSPDSVDEVHFMSTHPRTIDRVRAAMQASLDAPPQGAFGADSLLDRVDGMMWGDDPSQGVVRKRAFLHPTGFGFEVPGGFRLVNGDKAVVARHSAGAAIVFDGAAWRGDTDMLGYIRRVWLPRAQLAGGEAMEVNGMPAATATSRTRTKQGNVDVRVVAIRFDGDSVMRFTFFTPPSQTARLGAELKGATHSFRRLSAEERAAIRPLRIKVVRAKTGDTAEKLAARMTVDEWAVENFRLLNGLKPGEQPAAGQRVKLIV